ncbi:MAG TPA: ribosome biogenesis GTPase Der [Methylomirabilota bacterium]|jgi:GTP-binding protein|nr:ribosome biogenesis GTPase Der [Methylomirabilota bacterium]
MALPVVAIVGRPNVGKSTLFNRLIGSRRALVRDTPGVTRDRLHGVCEFGRWRATVVDTGGLDPSSDEPLATQVRRQVLAAIAQADALVLVLDGREGVTPLDDDVARLLRRVAKPVVVAVNKVDGPGQEPALAEAYRLGMEPVLGISAEHGRGVAELIETLAAQLPAPGSAAEPAGTVLRIAVVGRPNVGKSSLVNAIAGEDRVVVHAEPGTTRDAVDTPVTVAGRPYLLVDTAGLRRKGRTVGVLDKLAAVMARRSLERSDVVLLVVDGTEPVTAQDAHIAGYADAAGRGVVLVVNKWDLVATADRAPEIVRALRERLPFLAHAPVVFVSARAHTGLPELFEAIDRVGADYAKEVSTGELNRVLAAAVARRPPAGVHGKTLRVYYATQTGTRPPTFLLFVNDPAALHFSYERYLIGALREAFGFVGCPVRLRLRRRRPSRSEVAP